MESLVKLIMLGKDMFSKKIKNVKIIFLLTLFIQNIAYANNQTVVDIVDYLKNFKNISVSFIQNSETDISEGIISIGDNRLRVDYEIPTKITIILDNDKAMYYNKELEEDEFFNPKDTNAWFFYDIFKNPEFFNDSKLLSESNTLILNKKGEHEQINYKIKIFFENNPLLIRKIVLNVDENKMDLSFFDHKQNETFGKNHFKLINPSFFN